MVLATDAEYIKAEEFLLCLICSVIMSYNLNQKLQKTNTNSILQAQSGNALETPKLNLLAVFANGAAYQGFP